MPTINDFLKDVDDYRKKLEEYRNKPELVNPYSVIGGVAKVLISAVPLVSEIKWLSKGFEWLGGFLENYSKKQN
jgi:hypothetical protein